MMIDVKDIKENEDGSMNCVVDVDEETVTFLIRYGIVKAIHEAITLAEKEYTQKNEQS